MQTNTTEIISDKVYTFEDFASKYIVAMIMTLSMILTFRDDK